MTLSTPTSPHDRIHESVTKVMLRVIYALIPGLVAYVWFFGWGVVINIFLAIIVALICETAVLAARKSPIKPFITDGSAIVTATLLALAIPPLAPWWVTLIGAAFAIIVAKHLYGGLGYNPFNPAMVGYVMLLISFPKEMTIWLAPISTSESHLGFIDTLAYIFTDHLPTGITFDALTEATPLDSLKIHLGLGNTVGEIREQLGLQTNVGDVLSVSPIFAHIGGLGLILIGAGFLIGSLWLIRKKVISWHIPAAVLGSLSVAVLLLYLIDPELFGLGIMVTAIKEKLGLQPQISEILGVSPIFGVMGGVGWEWIGAGFLTGGIWLIYKKVISWHIPVAMLGSLSAIALLFYLVNPDQYASPLFHLYSGAAMLGAFFIATDPVTASTTPQGRLAYGAGIGILTYVIRTWGGYPDAVAFAVLLMNMTVPVIDYYLKPRVFGHKD